MKVFVYGTLKMSYGDVFNHVSGYEPDRAISATINGTMYGRGGFPGVDVSQAGVVRGEIIELSPQTHSIAEIDDALDGLDSYEGVSHGLYERKRVTATDDDGGSHICEIYVFRRLYEPEALINQAGEYEWTRA